jgi:hypothetical protein
LRPPFGRFSEPLRAPVVLCPFHDLAGREDLLQDEGRRA